jgi:hypothetical protein
MRRKHTLSGISLEKIYAFEEDRRTKERALSAR